MEINEFVVAYEKAIRMSAFFGILGVMALWEILAPRRALTVSKAVRWVNNLGIVFFNSFLLRLIFPAAAVGMASFASAQGNIIDVRDGKVVRFREFLYHSAGDQKPFTMSWSHA